MPGFDIVAVQVATPPERDTLPQITDAPDLKVTVPVGTEAATALDLDILATPWFEVDTVAVNWKG